MYVYSCECCGGSHYCVSFSGITSLSPLSFSTETRITYFPSDCDSDILLNQQAYRLFENKKKRLFCCVTNRLHDVVMTNRWQHTLLSNCHIDVTNVRLQGKVCTRLQDLQWRMGVMVGEKGKDLPHPRKACQPACRSLETHAEFCSKMHSSLFGCVAVL